MSAPLVENESIGPSSDVDRRRKRKKRKKKKSKRRSKRRSRSSATSRTIVKPDKSLQRVRLRGLGNLVETKIIKRPRLYSDTWYISNLLGEKLNTSKRFASSKKIWVKFPLNSTLASFGYLLGKVLFCDQNHVYVKICRDYFINFISKEVLDENLFSQIHKVHLRDVCFYNNSHLMSFDYNTTTKLVDRLKYLKNRRCHRWSFAQFEEINLGLLTHFFRNELKYFENPFLSFGSSFLLTLNSGKYFEKRLFESKSESDLEFFSFMRQIYFEAKQTRQSLIIHRLMNNYDSSIFLNIIKYLVCLEASFISSESLSVSEIEDDRRTVNTEHISNARFIRKHSIELFDGFNRESNILSVKFMEKFEAYTHLLEKFLKFITLQERKVISVSTNKFIVHFDSNGYISDLTLQVFDVDLSCFAFDDDCLFGVFYDLIEDSKHINKYLPHIEFYKEHKKLEIERVKNSLLVIGLDQDEIEVVLRSLKFVIFCLNINAKALNEKNYLLKTNTALKQIFKLLETSSDNFKEFVTTELLTADEVLNSFDYLAQYTYNQIVSFIFNRSIDSNSPAALEILDFKGLFEKELFVPKDASDENDYNTLINFKRYEDLNVIKTLGACNYFELEGTLSDFVEQLDFFKFRVSKNVIKHNYLSYTYTTDIEKGLKSTDSIFEVNHYDSYAIDVLQPKNCTLKYNLRDHLSQIKVKPFVEKFITHFSKSKISKLLSYSEKTTSTKLLNGNVKSILTLNSEINLLDQFNLYGLRKLLQLHDLNKFPILRSLIYVVETFFCYSLVSKEVYKRNLAIYRQIKRKQLVSPNSVIQFVSSLLTDIFGTSSENVAWCIKVEQIGANRKHIVYFTSSAYKTLTCLRFAIRERAVLTIQHHFAFVFKRQMSILKIQRFTRDIVLKPHVQYRNVSKIVSAYFSSKVRQDTKRILSAVRVIQSFIRMILVQFSYKNQLNKMSLIVKVQANFRRYRVRKKYKVLKSITSLKNSYLKEGDFIVFTSAVVDVGSINTLYELILTSQKRLIIIDLKTNLINLEIEGATLGTNVIIKLHPILKVSCLIINGKYQYYDILNKSYTQFKSQLNATVNFTNFLKYSTSDLVKFYNRCVFYAAVCKKKNRHRTKGFIKSKNKLIIYYNSKVYWLNLKLFQLEKKKNNPFILADEFSFSLETSTSMSNESFAESKQGYTLTQLLSSDILVKSLQLTLDIKVDIEKESTIVLQNTLTLNKKVDSLKFKTYSVKDRSIFMKLLKLGISLEKESFVQSSKAKVSTTMGNFSSFQFKFIFRNARCITIYNMIYSIMRDIHRTPTMNNSYPGLYYKISTEDYLENHSPEACFTTKAYKKHIRRTRKKIVKQRYKRNLYLHYIKNKHKLLKGRVENKNELSFEEGKLDSKLCKIFLELKRKDLMSLFSLSGITTVEDAVKLTEKDFKKTLNIRSKTDIEELMFALRAFDLTTGETARQKLKLALCNINKPQYFNCFVDNAFGSIENVVKLSPNEMKQRFKIDNLDDTIEILKVFKHYASFKPVLRNRREKKGRLVWPTKERYVCPTCHKQYPNDFETCISCGYYNDADYKNRMLPNKLWKCKSCNRWNRLTSQLCENVFCSKKMPHTDMEVKDIAEWYSTKSNLRFFDKESSLYQFELVAEVDANARRRRTLYEKGAFVRYVNLDETLKEVGVAFSAFGFIEEVLPETQEYRVVFERTMSDGTSGGTVETLVCHKDIELVPEDMLDTEDEDKS